MAARSGGRDGEGADREGNRARERARRAQLARAAVAQELAGATADAVAVASVLPLHPEDPEAACAAAGVSATGQAAVDLVARARREHPDLAAGRPQGLRRLVQAAVGVLSAQLLRCASTVSPRDVPHATRGLAQTVALMVPEEAPAYAQIVIEVVPPEGGGR